MASQGLTPSIGQWKAVVWRRCKSCGGVFAVRRERGRPQSYCSAVCRHEALKLARRNRKPDTQRHEHTCPHCSGDFLGYRRTVYCSKACNDRARRTLPDCVCQQCGDMYHPIKHSQMTFCGHRCLFQYRTEQARYRQGLREWAASRYVQVMICRACCVCRRTYRSARLTVLTCSTRCNEQMHMLRARRRYRVSSGGLACRRCGGLLEYHQSVCANCRAEGKRRSRRKSKHRRRMRMRDGRHDVFDSHEIFARDGWCCQLCKKRVDLGCDVNDDRFPNLDHIVAVSKGGDHTRLNTQCLCRKCNLEKSDGGGGQLLLLGG